MNRQAEQSAISAHARRRYAEHHPLATEADLRGAIELGESVCTELARALLGRTSIRDGDQYKLRDSIYIASPDKRGLFVVAFGKVVTYARLSAEARRILTG